MAREVFKSMDPSDLADRINCLRAMNTLIQSANDETVYFNWINIVPDQAEEDDFVEIAMNQPDTFAEACGLFLRLMCCRDMDEGGLYIGGEVYGKED